MIYKCETACRAIDWRPQPARVAFRKSFFDQAGGARWTKAEVQSVHGPFGGATFGSVQCREECIPLRAPCETDSFLGMYLLNIDALVTDLRAGRVRVRDALFHKAMLVILWVVSWIASELRLDFIGATHGSALLLCQAFAIYVCYCANGYGSKTARITRFSMIGACVGLRISCCMAPILALDFPPVFWQSLLGRAAATLVGLQTIDPLWIACGCSVLWGWRVAAHMERAVDNAWSARVDRDSIPLALSERRAGFFFRRDERSR